MSTQSLDEKNALARDAADPLSRFRERFHEARDAASGEALLYLCGNSLGLQPRGTDEDLGRELGLWAERAVEGHFEGDHPWYSYHEDLSRSMAGVVGARPGEVVVMNSLTVNLHLLMISFYRPSGARTKLLIEEGAFPSDTYAAKSQVALHGLDVDEHLLLARPREGESLLRSEDIVAQIQEAGEELALVLLPGVQYYTGQALDIAAITRAGHEEGALVGFDLAHAAGNLALQLHDDGPDFAAWCTYKYLNAGPGAVAAAFVHERHASRRDLPRLAGWWGNDPATRFKMHLIPDFTPQPGAAGWQLSNPPILGMTAIRRSLSLFVEAGMDRLRARSLAMGDYFLELLDALHPERIEVITPREHAARGCQLSLRVKDAPRELFDRLRARGVVGDFRPPDVIRVAPTPLYNSYHDIWRFVTILGECAD